jgi:hypothetical protein
MSTTLEYLLAKAKELCFVLADLMSKSAINKA